MFSPEQIMAMILCKIKEDAERYFGKPVKDAVLTVPAYFDDAQRAAVNDAGRIAGLDVLRVVNEPTAAALAYGLDKTDQAERQVLVYNLGASDVDVSVITIEDGVLETRTTISDTHLVEKGFDDRVVRYLANNHDRNNVDIIEDAKNPIDLLAELEKAKNVLSSQETTSIDPLSFLTGNCVYEAFGRAQSEAVSDDLSIKTLVYVERALEDLKMQKGDIDDVVLYGSSTRIPEVQQILEGYFGKRVRNDINPEEVVVFGAAVQGSILGGDYPCECCGMNDVNRLSLGVALTNGIMSPLVERGAVIPNKRSQIFSTTADNQSTFIVEVFEGESFLTIDNRKLAEFKLTDIPQVTAIIDLQTYLG